MDPTGIHRWGPGFEPPAEPRVDEAATSRRPWVRVGRALLVLAKLANFIVPFAAGLWLALRGHRVDAGTGLAMALSFPIGWSLLASHPAQLIAGTVASRGAAPGPRRVMITCFLATGWQYCFLAASTLAVFSWFGGRVRAHNELPLMLWAYGAVMGPFSWMAGADHGSDSAPSFALGFAFVACLVNAALVHWSIALTTSAVVLGLLAGAGAALNAALAGRAAARLRRGGPAARRAEIETVGRNLHGILARELPRGE